MKNDIEVFPDQNKIFEGYMENEDFKHAFLVGAANLPVEIEKDLSIGNRTKWIDSFGNKSASVITALGLLGEKRPEVAKLVTETVQQIDQLKSSIRREDRDANPDEQEALLKFIENLKDKITT